MFTDKQLKQSNIKIGVIGEDIACTWLQKRNFLIVDRNYNRKWGEIDIVAAKDKILQFVEVKSITVKNSLDKQGQRPEENVHELKVRRLKRVIQTYLLEKRHGLAAEFKFHIMVVRMNSATRRASVEFLEDIIL